jgi:hypothetical protein
MAEAQDNTVDIGAGIPLQKNGYPAQQNIRCCHILQHFQSWTPGARSISMDLCTGRGSCVENCPVTNQIVNFNQG